jgi:hypothetical protein
MNNNLNALLSFGYERSKAIEALNQAGNDLNKAIDILTETNGIRYSVKYLVVEIGICQ